MRRRFALIVATLCVSWATHAQEASPTETPARTQADAKEPVKTEIYADEAFFDAQNNLGTFSGNVKVIDPRFSMQADRLTVNISKDQKQGLEKAVAEGNVGVVREQPGKDGKTDRAIGRAEKAVYTASDGNVVLTGLPRVQQGLNMHVATSPSTVMVLNAKGQLETRGPSRTELHQEKGQKTFDPTKQ